MAMKDAKEIINFILIVFGCLLAIMLLTILIIKLVKKYKKKKKLSLRLIWKTSKTTKIVCTEASFELYIPICSIGTSTIHQ